MNRLIIIGNGFDLAHGLPTKYENFIDYLWQNIAKTPELYTDLVYVDKSNFSFLEGREITNYLDFHQSLEDYRIYRIDNYQNIGWEKDGSFSVIKIREYKTQYIFRFESEFFKIITQTCIKNWVDIENEYYKLLKLCLKEKNNELITEINEEFEIIKKLLKQYLLEEVEEKYDFTQLSKFPFHNIFLPEFQNNFDIKKFSKEFSQGERGVIEAEMVNLKNGLGKVRTHIVNFNYTSLIQKHLIHVVNGTRNIEIFNNSIHGDLHEINNPINFGFGDEMDRQYSEIEEKDDNEYLRNIKSFAYFNTPNYRKLIDFTDASEFQVYILGHSCGLSDRTLLNKIFEHHNCRSIKIFFREYKIPKPYNTMDNYTEIAQNISRHFNKKDLMREKIVDKTLCQPLPQIKLPLK